jgi:hypothetical protein
MKQPRSSLIGTPLLFIVACAELVGGDEQSSVHDCRQKVEKVEKVEKPDADMPEKPDCERAPAAPKAVPAPAPEPVRCDDPEPPPEPWDGTGRSEAVRGA